ncbi:MAG: GntR family transcriptional regulator [Rhodocyclaceae bacterium]
MSDTDTSVVASLRRLILEGVIPQGERMAEIPVAERLGVSRTPVRLAFRVLEQEGLLARVGKRGLVVRAFSEADVMCAVEVRGVLEGLAARRLAEAGMTAAVSDTLQAALHDGAQVLDKGYLVEADIAAWSDLNARFHKTIVEATGARPIADAIARNNHLPFASSDSIVIDFGALGREYEKLRVAQLQHQLLFGALVSGEGARAEMLMREHAWVGLRYGELLEPARRATP